MQKAKAISTTIGALALALCGEAVADPWLSLHGLDVPSTMRRATYGWVLDDFDSGADPTLSSPLTASTVWANGVVDAEAPLIRAGIDAPVGKALWTNRLQAGQKKISGHDGRLRADEADLDGDGFSDRLLWQRRVAGLAEAGQFGNIGVRSGLRWPDLGVGFSYVRRRDILFPGSSIFAFPTTTVELSSTADATSIFNLDSGEIISARDSASELALKTNRQIFGFDLGGRLGALGGGFGFGYELLNQDDTVTSTTTADLNGAKYGTTAYRNFSRDEGAIVTALRFDGRHSVGVDRFVVWTGGLAIRRPQSAKWLGTEAVAEFDVDAANALEQWIREPILEKQEATRLDARLGIGLSDEGPLFRYGFGLDWRAVSDKSTQTYRDRLIYRINEPGVAGQTPPVFLSADGYGLWTVESAETVYEYAIGGGGRYAVNSYLGLMMGSRVGYRQYDLHWTQTLTASQAVVGNRTTGTGVLDPVEVPYANFDIPDAVLREFSETFVDLNFGFAFNINRADLTTLFTLNDAANLAVVVEGVWRW